MDVNIFGTHLIPTCIYFLSTGGKRVRIMHRIYASFREKKKKN